MNRSTSSFRANCGVRYDGKGRMSTVLSHHLLQFEQTFLVASPALKIESESEAELPF